MSMHHHTTPMSHMSHNSTPMSHGNMNHGNMNHGSNTNHYMQMWFVAGTEVTIVFKEWKVNTVGGLVGSMIALMFLGLLYEGLKVGREILKLKAARKVVVRESYDLNGDSHKKKPEPTYIVSPPRDMLLSKLHFLQTVLHMLQVFLGYFLMLAFMTYNAWVCLAVILGAGLGYFLFGWKSVSTVDIGGHCL